MQRRIELGKGLLHHPGVLLLDEPTTGLDPGARRDLWQYLQMLRDEEHVSVLVTTHLMEEAERCDRLAIMNEGNLVALGTPEELKSEIGGDVVCWMRLTTRERWQSASGPIFTWRPPFWKIRCA
jgi:ABC-2 type transport system ATP-binding protein